MSLSLRQTEKSFTCTGDQLLRPTVETENKCETDTRHHLRKMILSISPSLQNISCEWNFIIIIIIHRPSMFQQVSL